jgi:hypothetical protein
MNVSAELELKWLRSAVTVKFLKPNVVQLVKPVTGGISEEGSCEPA